MKILYLEDSLNDFELLDLSLSKNKAQYELYRAEDKPQLITALNTHTFDIVISDYNLSKFTGMEALRIVKEQSPTLPFVVISGTVGEEQAVSLLHEGASDFLLKKNVKKLPFIIERALRAKRIEDERRNFQKELINKNLILDSLFHSFEEMVFLKDAHGKYLKVNSAFSRFHGLTEKAILGLTDKELFDESFSRKASETEDDIKKNRHSTSYDIEYLGIDGTIKILEVLKYPVLNEDIVTGVVGSFRDITARRQLEEKNAKSQHILNQAERLTHSGSFEYNSDADILNCSPHFIKMMQINGTTKISLMKFIGLVFTDDRKIFTDEIHKVLSGEITATIEHRFIPMGGEEIRYGRTILSPDYTQNGKHIFYGTIVDTTTDYEYNMALLNIQEQERTNISRELHDNTGQKLSASALFLDSLISKYSRDPELSKVRNLINQSLTDIRSMSSMLSSSGINEFGLENSIRQLQEQIPLEIDCELNYSIQEKSVSEFISTQTFRIIQEAISNIQKHSQAKKIVIDLEQNKSLINLRIHDNGKGFDNNSENRGNGLRNMEQRVKKCNGLLHIDSKLNAGTLIDIKLPIK